MNTLREGLTGLVDDFVNYLLGNLLRKKNFIEYRDCSSGRVNNELNNLRLLLSR